MERNNRRPFESKNFHRPLNKNQLKGPNFLNQKNLHHEWSTGDPYQTGIAYLKNKNFQLAIISLKENLKINPDCLSTHLALGISYLNLNQFLEAVQEFNRVLELEHHNYDARFNLSNAYSRLGMLEKSNKELQAILKIPPGSETSLQIDYGQIKKKLADNLFLLGNKMFKAKVTEEALKYYQEALEIEENNPEVLYQIALCQQQNGNNEETIFYLEKALKFNQNKEKVWEIYNLLIDLKTKSGQPEEVFNLCQQILTIFPKNPKAYLLIGNIWLEKGNLAEALKNFEMVISLEARNIQALLNIGEIYVRSRQLSKATNYYHKILALEPTHPVALCNLAVIKYNLNEKNLAFSIFLRLDDVANERNYLVNKYLGLIWLEKGDPARACDQFEKAVFLHQKDADIFINLGVCYHRLNKHQQAINTYQKSLEIDPENLLAWKNLSLLYFETDQNELAMELFEKIRQVEPNNKQTLKRIADTYKKIADYSKAIDAYKNLLQKDPDSAEIAFALAICYFETDQLPEALGIFKKLITVSKNFMAGSNLYLSRIFEKHQEYGQALEYAKKAVYADAKFVDGFIQYGRMSLVSGQRENAEKYFKKALSLDDQNIMAHELLRKLIRENENKKGTTKSNQEVVPE